MKTLVGKLFPTLNLSSLMVWPIVIILLAVLWVSLLLVLPLYLLKNISLVLWDMCKGGKLLMEQEQMESKLQDSSLGDSINMMRRTSDGRATNIGEAYGSFMR